ncbi:hypothetical protein NP233_g1456 [Leucocoprinus birnbaumii]|uniref:Carboxylic ester hydrolase n=1 Tax=Leucocoprinus birnbaumii TaxID=56174 RepID=A0AAD5YZI9_9AGAR|nr:hypothetical protein NP233_g1456 [Leucocoprinus birnbaumii]
MKDRIHTMKLASLFTATAIWIAACLGAPEVKLGKTTLRIPFAEPPLGNLRLRPPVLKTTLDPGTFDASNFKAACLQPGVPASLVSEDCLTINVFRPSGVTPNSKLPVLFWVFGGGFEIGTGAIYNGSAIVAQSVARGTPLIYVNFNYRLGPLGYPQGVEAAKENALNLALKDELAALQWIQANIGAFGGDKTKVTIFGESAGAIMTSILFLNSGLERFARAAIFESGSQATPSIFGPEHRQVDWDNFVASISSCSTLSGTPHTFDCIQRANTTEILTGLLAAIAEAPELFAFDPTIDGPGGVYPDYPSKLFARGHFSKLPFISGTNLDEGTVFIPTTINSEAMIHEFIVANFSPPIVQPAALQKATDKLLELYPDVPALGSPFNTGNDTFGLSSQFKRASAIQGDLVFTSQRRLWQQTAAKAGVATWGYLFTQPQPGNPDFFGISHGSEISYVYGAPTDQSASSLKLSTMMIDYWVSFATSLNPNDGKGAQRPHWEQFTPRNQRVIQLNGDNTMMINDTFRKEQMDFINSVPPVFLHRRGTH